MITIYHIEARRSERVAWLMEELGLPYELTFTEKDIIASSQAIKAVHPIGAAPTIRDGDLLLCESAAILEYIINRHGGGRLGVRPDQAQYPLYLQWLHFAEGSAMSRIMGEFMLKPLLKEVSVDRSPIARLHLGASKRMAEFFELSLAGRPFFAGAAFTAADIMMFLPASFCLRGRTAADYPLLSAWTERMTARPAYQRMLARALPNGPPPSLMGWPKENPAPG